MGLLNWISWGYSLKDKTKQEVIEAGQEIYKLFSRKWENTFLLYFEVYLQCKGREGGRAPQVSLRARAVTGWTQEPGRPSWAPCGWQRPHDSSCHLLFPRTCMHEKLDGSRGGTESQVRHCGIRHPERLTLLAALVWVTTFGNNALWLPLVLDRGC